MERQKRDKIKKEKKAVIDKEERARKKGKRK